jgi:hypothetical protein
MCKHDTFVLCDLSERSLCVQSASGEKLQESESESERVGACERGGRERARERESRGRGSDRVNAARQEGGRERKVKVSLGGAACLSSAAPLKRNARRRRG